VTSGDKPLVWLADKVRTPPFSKRARLEAGILLRRLQLGELPSMPHCRPMPGIGGGCHELRIRDGAVFWRIVVLIEEGVIVVLDVFPKKTRTTSLRAMERCRRRIDQWRRVERDDQ
jgi:phage-related protein